jgi:hypothetical protein
LWCTYQRAKIAHALALLCWMLIKATLKAAAFGDDEMPHLPSNGLRALATVRLLCRRHCRCMLSTPGGVLGKVRAHFPCPPRPRHHAHVQDQRRGSRHSQAGSGSLPLPWRWNISMVSTSS